MCNGHFEALWIWEPNIMTNGDERITTVTRRVSAESISNTGQPNFETDSSSLDEDVGNESTKISLITKGKQSRAASGREKDMSKSSWKQKIPFFQKEIETERIVKINDFQNIDVRYANNFIKTSKYNLLTFLPMNLFEQFQRLANFYFLILLILQLIPIISSVTWVSTAMPLLAVLAVSAIKDGYDDVQRHINDKKVNNRVSNVVQAGIPDQKLWAKVQVGDIIKLTNNEQVVADLLILSTSEPNGLCYVETSELDGETNLKCRQALPETQNVEETVGSLRGEIVCEAPNNNLNSFKGTLHIDGEKYPLSNDNILLRGSIVRNIEWCHGVVIFAGKDTKLMMNSGKSKFKRTHIDRMLNAFMIGIIVLLCILCTFCTLGSGIFETLIGQHFRIYLPWDPAVSDEPRPGAATIAALNFLSYVILLQTVMPISLYVSIEIIRFVQSLYINFDTEMCYVVKGSKNYSLARTTTLNEELGQIEYIFSDKTGTLTQNIMTFNKCSINGKKYGDLEEDEEEIEVDFSNNHLADKDFKWYDPKLTTDVEKDGQVQEFFRLLALCHTAMSEDIEGELAYQAQSPDEGALITAARNFGFVFKDRTPETITLQEQGEEVQYDVLCILDFNNVRKRMSVIVERHNKITLYCKGADNIIYERLGTGNNSIKNVSQAHLDAFAAEGLRTLALASRDLTYEEYTAWKTRQHEAATSLENREERLDQVYELIEKDLRLIGITAIEDKLQDGVPETIANLMLADIKVWVLTGDKQETAINIGYSCELLTQDMADVFIIDAHDEKEVEQQISKHINTVKQGTSSSIGALSSDETLTKSYALVVAGQSLFHALTSDQEINFLKLACLCRAVICCRVTPKQKAMIVKLVKKNKEAITLSIGDGANDVNMIKTADVGVGISGQEGLQAVLASDYGIPQFRFLNRLLLVHGRWSYLRIARFLNYFFYKNFAFTLSNFLFAFYCGFTAMNLYEEYFITFYNLFYTALPVLCIGTFEKDVNDKYSLAYPKLYQPGLKRTLFNLKTFIRSASHGFISAMLLFYFTFGIYGNKTNNDGMGLSDLRTFGSCLGTFLFITVTIQICLEVGYWTWTHVIFISLSVVAFIMFTCITYLKGTQNYLGSLKAPVKDGQFWLTLILMEIILMTPIIAYRFILYRLKPTLVDRLRLKKDYRTAKPAKSWIPSFLRFKKDRSESKDVAVEEDLHHPEYQMELKQRRRRLTSNLSIHSSITTSSMGRGYAFSQERGWGERISRGTMRSRTSEKRKPHRSLIKDIKRELPRPRSLLLK